MFWATALVLFWLLAAEVRKPAESPSVLPTPLPPTDTEPPGTAIADDDGQDIFRGADDVDELLRLALQETDLRLQRSREDDPAKREALQDRIEALQEQRLEIAQRKPPNPSEGERP